MIATVVAVGLCCVLGLAIGAGFKLYYSFKRFVSETIEKSIPADLIEEIVKGIKSPWKRWVAQRILLFSRSRFVERIYKVVTAPETVAGMAIKVGGFLIAGLVVGLISALERYFAAVPLYYSLSGSAAGVLIGWFTFRFTIDRLLDYLILKISGFSTSSIRRGADYLGLELKRVVASVNGETNPVDLESAVVSEVAEQDRSS